MKSTSKRSATGEQTLQVGSLARWTGHAGWSYTVRVTHTDANRTEGVVVDSNVWPISLATGRKLAFPTYELTLVS